MEECSNPNDRMFERLRRRLRGRSRARSNDEWIRDLSNSDPRAIEDLRAELLRGVRIVLRRGAPRGMRGLDEDLAQDAVLKVLGNLDTFRGDCRFSTWAHKIAVRLVYTELRRKRWDDVPLESHVDTASSPYSDGNRAITGLNRVTEKDTTQLLRRIMESDLTLKQRKAIEAVMLREMPMEEAARRLGSNRNALYKLLYDARRRLKRGFEERGFALEDLISDPG